MAWTGLWVTNELDAWVEINLMENWEDFQKESSLLAFQDKT